MDALHIIDHASGRFAEPGELMSTLIWPCSPGASFVNGGFSACSGV